MAVKRKTKVTRTRRVSVAPKFEVVEETNSLVVPSVKKTIIEKLAPVLVVAVVVLAFILGAMWSKIKYLEAGGAKGGVAANSKYKKLSDAFSAYAKELKIDQKKFNSCLSSGSKKDLVDADAKEASGLGVQGTPGFFINGKFLPGAFPFDAFKEVIDKELAGKGTTKVTDYSTTLQQSGFVAEPKTVTVGNSATKGEGQVVVVEFSDFQCPFCTRAKPTVEKVLKDYNGKVKVVYKHYPLDQLHPNARKAAEASECARDQGKFWEMHDVLFDRQAEWAGVPQT